jgi:hypothetical protein
MQQLLSADIHKLATYSDALCFESTSIPLNISSLRYRGPVAHEDTSGLRLKKCITAWRVVDKVDGRKAASKLPPNDFNVSSRDVLFGQQQPITDRKSSYDNFESSVKPLPVIPEETKDVAITNSVSVTSASAVERHHLETNVSLFISEDVLFTFKGGNFERCELRGVVGAQVHQRTSENSSSSTSALEINVLDTQKVLSNFVVNKAFIKDGHSTLTNEPLEHRTISLSGVPFNGEKPSPVFKYSANSSLQGQFLRARSQVKVILPNAKVYVQISVNPANRPSIDSILVQASLSGTKLHPFFEMMPYYIILCTNIVFSK